MESIVSIIVTVLCSVIASSGFWAWIQKKDDKKSLQSQMLIGHGLHRTWMDHQR